MRKNNFKAVECCPPFEDKPEYYKLDIDTPYYKRVFHEYDDFACYHLMKGNVNAGEWIKLRTNADLSEGGNLETIGAAEIITEAELTKKMGIVFADKVETKMTDKEYVLSIYPDAEIRTGNFLFSSAPRRTIQFAVFKNAKAKDRLAAVGWYEEEAWFLAAIYLKATHTKKR